MAAVLLGCQQLEERIDSVSSRVDNLENTQIASLKQQIAAMDESVGKLEKTDAELKGYIETLQGTADALRKSIADSDAKISELEKSLDRAIRDAQNSDASLKGELEQQITAAKTDVLEQLAAAKTAMESRLEQIESTITSLQTKDSELEKKIADLKTSMDAQLSGEISSAKDWATATFATLEQYNSIVSDISGIRGSIESLETSLKSLEESLTGRIRTEVADAIAPIKDQLVSEAAAKVVEGYTEAISSVRSEVEEISSRVKTLEDEVKLIKEDVDNIKQDLEEISSKLDSGQPGGIQSIVFVPEYSDGKARAYYNTEEDGSFTPGKMTLRFAVVPADMAAKIAGSWKSSLSLEATYTRTKAVAAGDDVSIPILEASASDGKLTVTASAETLDEAFFKEELSASVRLVVSLDGVGKSSEYVPMVPSVNMGQGEKLEIPDIYFKAYLVDNFDVNGDGEISADEALAVKQIDIASSSLPIRSLAGIEYFSNIESLDCSGNNLAVLDLKSNADLRTLNCSNNSIVELDLSDKSDLIDVDCSGNMINRLLLSNACGLRNLNCSNNLIEDIDLHDSRLILKIECYGNPVKKLNIDNCTELIGLLLRNRNVNAINGDGISFDGYDQASSFDFSACNLPFTSFKFTNSPSVTSLSLDGGFTTVDASDNELMASVDISRLSALESLNVSDCALTSLDVTKNRNLKSLDCSSNAISSLELSNNPALEYLNASELDMQELDLTGITQLKTLHIRNNGNLTKVVCTSREWLNLLDYHDDLSQSYVDIAGRLIGGSMIEIDGMVWAGYNVGASVDNLYGKTYFFATAQEVCPEGWRTPTNVELESLSMNYSSETTFRGMKGRWFSGSKAYSESVPAVFLPYCDYSYSSGIYWSSVRAGIYDGEDVSYCLYIQTRVGMPEVEVYYQWSDSREAVRCVKN